MSVIIVIPSYEPRQNVVSFVRKLGEQVREEILLINDGSSSEYEVVFQELSELPFVTLLSYPENKGKGFALKTGFQHIFSHMDEGTTIVTADSDGQHSIEDIQRIINYKTGLNKQTLVLGTRSFQRTTTPFKSYWGNRISSLFFRLATGIKCEDTQTGLRAFDSRLLIDLIAVSGERFDYEMNVLLKSKEMGIKLKQLPIATIYEENNQHSHFRAVQDSYLIYRPLLRYLFTAVVSLIVDISAFAFLVGDSPEMVIPATIIARLLSGLVNFLLARSWVFQDNTPIHSTLWKYSVLFVTQMLLSSLGISFLINFIPIAVISKLLVDGCLFVCSFVIQNRLIFQKKKVIE